MADISGIIEVWSLEKGLGFRCLMHIERNSVLLFMVPADTTRTIKQEYEILLNELQEYNEELMHKPRVLAVTKMDMLDDELQAEMKKEFPEGVPSIFISSVAQKNLTGLKDLLWLEINKQTV